MPKQRGLSNRDDVIHKFIHVIRGQRVILDSDLAMIYGVSTKRLNEQVKRNLKRFPADFMFQLTAREARMNRSQFATGSQKSGLRSQFATSSSHGGRRHSPYAFTEYGAVMAANVLNSERAVTMSIFVVRAFIKLRALAAGSHELVNQLENLERKLTARLNIHEEAIVRLFSEIRELLNSPPEPELPPKPKIGFHP